MSRYIDENDYERGELKHSDLIHRQKAYRQIYLKNRDKYPLKFSEYIVHHKDKNKTNNKISNLQILTKREHDRIHGITDKEQTTIETNPIKNPIIYTPESEEYSPKPTKSRLKGIITLIIIIILIFGFINLLPSKPYKEIYNAIELDMTASEIDTLLDKFSNEFKGGGISFNNEALWVWYFSLGPGSQDPLYFIAIYFRDNPYSINPNNNMYVATEARTYRVELWHKKDILKTKEVDNAGEIYSNQSEGGV